MTTLELALSIVCVGQTVALAALGAHAWRVTRARDWYRREFQNQQVRDFVDGLHKRVVR